MRAVRILLIDRDRQRRAGRQLHIRGDVERCGMLLTRAAADRPAGLGLVVDRTGHGKTTLLVIGLGTGELRLGWCLVRSRGTEEHRECAEHEVAVPGAAGPLTGQTGVGQRLELDRLGLHSGRNDGLERVGVLGEAARDGDGAVGSDRRRGAGHALELGRHERRRLLCGSRSWGRSWGRRRTRRRRRWRQELGDRRRHELSTGVRTDEHSLAIGREGHAPHARLRSLRAFLLPLRVHIPELDGAVEAAAGQSRAIGREADARHPVLMARERGKLLGVGGGPELDRAIGAGRGELRSVRRIDNGPERVGVSFELALFIACGCIPQLHEFIAAAGGDRRAVRREADGRDRPGMGGDGLDLLAVGRVPEHDGAVLAGRGQLRAVGREIERPHPSLVLLEVCLQSPRRQVPELDQAVVAGRCRKLAILRDLHRPDRSGVASQIAHPGAVRPPDDDVAGPVEQALTARGDERRAVAGIVGSDHPPREGGEVGRGSWRGGSGGGFSGSGSSLEKAGRHTAQGDFHTNEGQTSEASHHWGLHGGLHTGAETGAKPTNQKGNGPKAFRQCLPRRPPSIVPAHRPIPFGFPSPAPVGFLGALLPSCEGFDHVHAIPLVVVQTISRRQTPGGARRQWRSPRGGKPGLLAGAAGDGG